jgi:hypothetical protein
MKGHVLFAMSEYFLHEAIIKAPYTVALDIYRFWKIYSKRLKITTDFLCIIFGEYLLSLHDFGKNVPCKVFAVEL